MKKISADLSGKFLMEGNIIERVNKITIDSSVSNYEDDLCKSKIWEKDLLEQESILYKNPSFCCVVCDGCNYNCPGYEKN